MSTMPLPGAPRVRLRELGFDLLQAFGTAAYNESERARGNEFRLPNFERASSLCLLIGNGKALWEPFVAAVRASAALQCSRHPLDDYTEAAVSELRRGCASRSVAFFAHQREPVVPIQRIAEVAGLAELSPSHLSVHPRLGPWLGLRAVLVVDAEAPVAQPVPVSLCRACSRPCLPALERAIQAEHDSPGQAWKDWLMVRDSCPEGRTERYGEPQIRYHYTKDRQALTEGLVRSHGKASD